MLKKLVSSLALLLLIAVSTAYAQYTNVTAVVQDAAGSPYANSTYNVSFVIPPSATIQPVFTGTTQIITQPVFAGILTDGSGNLAITLPDNNQITPAGTQWRFSVCYHGTIPCFNTTLTITGASQDITTQLQAASALITTTFAGGVIAGNVTPSADGIYNLGSPILRWDNLYTLTGHFGLGEDAGYIGTALNAFEGTSSSYLVTSTAAAPTFAIARYEGTLATGPGIASYNLRLDTTTKAAVDVMSTIGGVFVTRSNSTNSGGTATANDTAQIALLANSSAIDTGSNADVVASNFIAATNYAGANTQLVNGSQVNVSIPRDSGVFGGASKPYTVGYSSLIVSHATCTATAATATTWTNGHAYGAGDIVKPTTFNANARYFWTAAGGVSDAAEPTWPSATGNSVVDNTVTWVNIGICDGTAGMLTDTSVAGVGWKIGALIAGVHDAGIAVTRNTFSPNIGILVNQAKTYGIYVGAKNFLTNDLNAGNQPLFSDNPPVGIALGNNALLSGSSTPLRLISTDGAGVEQDWDVVHLADKTLHFQYAGLDKVLWDNNGNLSITGGLTLGSSSASINAHYTGTASLNFTDWAGADCQDLTVGVTGAMDGDTVTIGVPLALASTAGVQFTGFVSAPNVVTVRGCKVTAGASANPAAATVRADAWHH